MYATLPRNVSLLIKVEKNTHSAHNASEFQSCSIEAREAAGFRSSITIAADFTDYSSTLSHEFEGVQYVHFHRGLMFFSCNPHTEKENCLIFSISLSIK